MNEKTELLKNIEIFKNLLEKFRATHKDEIPEEDLEYDNYLRFSGRVLTALEYARNELTNNPDANFSEVFFKLDEAIADIYCHNRFVDSKHARHYHDFYTSKLISLVDEHYAQISIPSLKQFKRITKNIVGQRITNLQPIDIAIGEYEFSLHKIRDEEFEQLHEHNQRVFKREQRIIATKKLLDTMENWLKDAMSLHTQCANCLLITKLSKKVKHILDFLQNSTF